MIHRQRLQRQFPDQSMGVMLKIEGNCSCLKAKVAHMVGHLPTGYGGGIFNYKKGTVMVTNSTFSNNSASGKQQGQGGGIENEGKLTVVGSTFSNNTASS